MVKKKKALAAALAAVLAVGVGLPAITTSADVNANFSAVAGSKFTAVYKDKTSSTQSTQEMTAFSFNHNGAQGYAYSLENKVTSTNLNQSVLASNMDEGGLHRLIVFAQSMTWSEVNDRIGSSLANAAEYQGAIQLAVHKLNKERSSKLSWQSTDPAYATMEQVAKYLVENYPADESLVAPTTMTTKMDKILTLNTSDSTYDYYGPFSFESNKSITPQVSFVPQKSGLDVVNGSFAQVSAMEKGKSYYLRVLKNQQLPSTTMTLSYVGEDTDLVVYGASPNQLVSVVKSPVTLTESIAVKTPDGGGILKIQNVAGDEYGDALNGATFDIKNEDGQVVQSVKIVTNGTIYSQELPIGIYTVENTGAASGYEVLTTPKQVSILSAGQMVDVKFVSQARMGKVQVVNTDSNGVRLNGGTFKIYDSGTNQQVKEFTIVSNGYIEVALPDGNYYLEQTLAPIGQESNSNRLYFEVSRTSSTPSVTVVNKTATNANHTIKIVLKDAVSGLAIPGGTFTILDANDRTVDTVTINSSGFGTSRSLVPGSYKIKQATAHGSYQMSSDTFSAILTADSAQKEVTITNVDKNQQNLKAGIQVLCSSGGTAIKGAIFGIYLNDSEVGRIVTDEKGYGTSGNLELATYTIKQLSTDSNYKVNEHEFTVHLSRNGEVSTLNVENYLAGGTYDSGRYTIHVQDQNGNDYPNATIYIKTQSGSTVSQADVNSEGDLTGTLYVGSYTAMASVQANGTIYNSNPVNFTVVKDQYANVDFTWYGSGFEASSNSTGDLGYLSIHCKDADGNNLKGATVRVTGSDYDKSFDTNLYGEVDVTLGVGSYKVWVEKVNGRSVQSDTNTVAVKRNVTTEVEFEWDGSFVYSDTISSSSGKNEILITALDYEGNKVKNSQFVLYAKGVEVERKSTDSLGETEFTGLSDGSYSVKQLTSNGVSVSSNELDVNLHGGSSVDVVFRLDSTERSSIGEVDNVSTITTQGSGSISGYVFEDVNANGIYDLNDKLMTNVMVYLYSERGSLLKDFEIGSDSKFIFSDLAEDVFEVRFELPSGYKFTEKTTEGDNLTRSKVNEIGRVIVDLAEENGKNVICGYVQTSEVIADPNAVIDINGSDGTTIGIGGTVSGSVIDVGGGTGYVDSTNPEKGENPSSVPTTGDRSVAGWIGCGVVLLAGLTFLAFRKRGEM